MHYPIFLRSKSDVLVSDIGMPDMGGYILIQQIRPLLPEQGEQVPAVALSAYAEDIDEERARQAGFQQHLSKPVEPDLLVQTIITVLENCDRS
jgi:CheY-like chemotaxis protein